MKHRVLTIMAAISIYTTSHCPYCVKAKALLDRKHISYEEINVEDPEERAKMISIAGGRTSVPQIFINGHHIGGCDDLHKLEKTGALEELLNKEQA